MRLKRIELAGFKSFVDPTSIDFDPGITAIVGPNGCGKSNIVDALRWVLGEHSARHLRGGVMDDLIFQGSDSRAPVAICDVELTFNIEVGALSPPYHQLHEIRIRRRLMRDGASDAFINGKMVRIKDVVDLFLDTGISTRAYAIIEQGSIARMVTAKPQERRVIFEEAAGVMKYRSRRHEAERRMNDTRVNLDRVLDLRDEVRSQCRSLKQQASRAERFKALQDEFAHLQSLSLALRYRDLQESYQTISQQLAAAKTDEAEAGQQLTASESSVLKARAKLLAHEADTQQQQDELRVLERQRADLQQQAERFCGEQRLLIERNDVVQQRLSEAELEQQRLTLDRQAIEQQLANQNDSALQESLQQADTAVKQAESAYQAQSNRRDRLLAEFERLRLNHEQATQQRHHAEQALARLEQRETQLTLRLTDLDEDLSLQQTEQSNAKDQQTLVQQQQHSAKSALRQAQIKRDDYSGECQRYAELFHAEESVLREHIGLAQELRGRSIHQDVSQNLREDFKRIGGVWIDECLHVPAGLEAAVAAALRGRSADVHMPEDIDATNLSALLQQASAAPIALFCNRWNDQPRLKISLATAMDMAAKHPLHDIFASIRLLDDITQVSLEDKHDCCVSRDGWRREPNGWLIPPSGNRIARRLAVQRRLRETELQIKQAEQRLQASRSQFKQAEQRLEALQQTWQQTHLKTTQCDSESHAADAAVQRLQHDVTALQQDQQRSRVALTELADERRHWQEQVAEASDVVGLHALQEQAEKNLRSQQKQLEQAEQLRHETRQHKAQADQALALFAQAHDYLLRQAESLNAADARLKTQLATDQTRLLQLQHELEQHQQQHQLDQQLALAVAALDSAHQAIQTMRSTGHNLQQLQQQAEHSERQARHVLQLTISQRQAFAVQQAQHDTRLQDCDAEIQQRCQTTAAQLLHETESTHKLKDADAIMQRVKSLDERIQRFGPVNLLAIDEFDQANTRETFLAAQASDLETSLDTLADTIARIDRTTKERFKTVFDQSNAYFKQTFPQLFGGGRAELRLDSDDILTAGVEVIAQPPGKHLQDLSLLSGGEKALTAVALVFSIFKIKPAPFCVLDEVDAPLDDANVVRFADMVRELSAEVQFLSISHNKITMKKADRLIGVSMPEAGVSKIISVDLQDIPN